MKHLLSIGAVALLILMSGCGTYATAVWQPPTRTAAAVAAAQTAVRAARPTVTNLPSSPTMQPTRTRFPETSTPLPATNTPEPTAESLPPIEAPDSAGGNISGDAANGQVLFTTFQPAVGFACATCHYADREDRLIGPGLLNVSVRAETRVPGQNAAEYLHTSIAEPGAFVVADYPDELMPRNWAEIYSEQQIGDLVAYLSTLR